jgi:GT2 family glycosyltransferase
MACADDRIARCGPGYCGRTTEDPFLSQQKVFEYAGAGGGFIDAYGYPFCRGRVFDAIEEDRGQYNDTRPIFWATGACMMIRSEVYHQFGGLDEDFFAHMEEIDLCWKIHRAFRTIWYCGSSTVYHVGAGTLGYDHPRKTYLNFRNNFSLIFKHFSTAEGCYKLPLRVLLDWVAAVAFLLKGRPQNAVAVLKAHLHFIRGIGRDIRKRRSLQKAYPTYSRSEIFKSLLIVDYYLQGRKSFDKIMKG